MLSSVFDVKKQQHQQQPPQPHAPPLPTIENPPLPPHIAQQVSDVEWSSYSRQGDNVVLVVSAVGGRVEAISRSCTRLWGGQPEDWCSGNLENFVHPQDWWPLRSVLGTLLQSKLASAASSPTDVDRLQPLDTTVSICTALSRYVAVNLWGRVILPSPQSAQPASLLLVASPAVDIYPQPDYEKQINIITTSTGKILFASPSILPALGWTPFDVINQDIGMIHLGDNDAVRNSIRSVSSSQTRLFGSISSESYLRHKYHFSLKYHQIGTIIFVVRKTSISEGKITVQQFLLDNKPVPLCAEVIVHVGTSVARSFTSSAVIAPHPAYPLPPQPAPTPDLGFQQTSAPGKTLHSPISLVASITPPPVSALLSDSASASMLSHPTVTATTAPAGAPFAPYIARSPSLLQSLRPSLPQTMLTEHGINADVGAPNSSLPFPWSLSAPSSSSPPPLPPAYYLHTQNPSGVFARTILPPPPPTSLRTSFASSSLSSSSSSSLSSLSSSSATTLSAQADTSVSNFRHAPHARAYKRAQPSESRELRCLSCNTNTTPEWRRGPQGIF